MKKTLTIFILSILTLSVFSQEKGFVDYFNTLPNEYSNFKYTIEKVDGKWQTTSNADYPITPIVDLSSRFIKIVDDGTGGGTVTLTASMYDKTNGEPIISIYLTEFDGMRVTGTTNFYEWKNEKWISITKSVLDR